MMWEKNKVIDIVRECVGRVSEKLTPTFSKADKYVTGVHFEHGHPIEIIETLSEKDKTQKFKFQKYPAVFLFQDFVESFSLKDNFQAKINIVICSSTRADFKASERYKENFEPILLPIYKELLEQLKGHPWSSAYFIEHEKIDRVFWGRQSLYGSEAGIFNDHLDAIELINLKLNVKLNLC